MLSLILVSLLFFLSGFALTLIKKNIPLPERICMGIGLGIVLNVTGVFVLNYFLKIPINFLTLVFYNFTVSLFLFVLYFIRERPENFTDFRVYENIFELKKNKIKIFKIILLFITLISVFEVQYFIHSDYEFPYHTDEWMHLARAVQIMDQEGITDTDPYLNKYGVGWMKGMNLEIGFHVFLSEFFILSGEDPVLFYKFLPPVFCVLASLMLFILVRKITSNFYAGIFSMLFFVSLKSAITILGVWFFVPLSMCFMLIFLFFYLFMEGMRRNSLSYFLFAAITISCIALIHPQSASWIYPVIILYLFVFGVRNILKVNFENILKFRNLVIGNFMLFFLPFLSFIYFFKILWKDNFETTITYFLTKFIVFRGCPEESGACEPDFIINFYGEIAVIFAGIGILYLLYKFIKNKGEDKFKSPLLLSWITVMVFLISLLHVEVIGKFAASIMGISYSPFTLLTAYHRILYETLLCLCALSGTGLYAVLTVIRKLIYEFKPPENSYEFTYRNLVLSVLSVFIIILVFYSVFEGYYDTKPRLYKDIDMGDYKAIKWIEENKGHYNIVFARPHVSETIYPISRNYVVSATMHARIPTTRERVEDTNKFFMGDCEVKKKILNKYEVDYVLVEYEIKCSFLEEIYHEKDYIYRFNNKTA